MNIKQLKIEIENRIKLIKNNKNNISKIRKTCDKIKKICIYEIVIVAIFTIFAIGTINPILNILITLLGIGTVGYLCSIISFNILYKVCEKKETNYLKEIETLESHISNLKERKQLIEEIEKENIIVRDLYEFTNKDRIVNFETSQKVKKLY